MSVRRKLYGLAALVVVVFVMTGAWYFKIRTKAQEQIKIASPRVCSAEVDVRSEIAKFSREDPNVSEPFNRLLAAAGSSAQCRDQVIQELVLAMKGNPDLLKRPNFNLWHGAALLLGSLKAIEALDFLIDHLNDNDGLFSASMNDQPAVRPVTMMGSAAVPKLVYALKHHPKAEIRLTVALCLGDIGGQEASDALKEAAKTDSNECVRRFIELSLMEPTKEVLQQRLVAYRCGN